VSAASILFGICAADTTVASLLFDGTVTHLYPAGVVPQGQARPYATYATVGGRPVNSMDTPSLADNFRIQLNGWANDPDSAAAITAALRAALENTSTQIANSVGIRTVAFNGQSFDEATRLFGDSFDVSLWTTLGNSIITPVTVDPLRVYFSGDPLQLLAGENIPARRVVVVRAGVMYLADPTAPADAGEVIGITQDVVANGSYGYVRTHGLMIDTTWNWAPGSLFYTTGGVLTQTLPVAETAEVARVVSATQILVDIKSPG
jgi:hypothetical protein